MKNIKKALIISLVLVASLGGIFGFSANAATTMPTTAPRPIINPPLGNGTEGGTDLQTILYNVIDVVQTLLIMATTLYLIYAGFMFVTAKGDPAKIKKARDGLLWGLVGAALILCAEVLAHGVSDTVKEVFKSK